MIEIRCRGKLHGILVGDDTVEIKCRSALCGAKPGVVVLHEFNVHTGEITKTSRFKDPNGRSRG
jgi:hypothetical protein